MNLGLKKRINCSSASSQLFGKLGGLLERATSRAVFAGCSLKDRTEHSMVPETSRSEALLLVPGSFQDKVV